MFNFNIKLPHIERYRFAIERKAATYLDIFEVACSYSILLLHYDHVRAITFARAFLIRFVFLIIMNLDAWQRIPAAAKIEFPLGVVFLFYNVQRCIRDFSQCRFHVSNFFFFLLYCPLSL